MLQKIFGTKNERELKKMRPIVARIGELEPKMAVRSDAELSGLTADFRRRLANGATLTDLLPEAFAAVREAGRRALGMRHFDVQLMGGIALHEGKIAEMQTGEGKTLVATLPLYLNALERRGAHLVTVNDYLARRDAEWMSRIYGRLGLSTGIIIPGLNDQQRWRSYRCDITYATNSELGFDYLRDQMKKSITACVQREPHFAIVDEVDSILVDEARTPLIISGASDEAADLYRRIDGIVPKLQRDVDFTVDEKARSVAMTDRGTQRTEELLGLGNLYDPENSTTLHHVTQALRAHTLYVRDVDYLVENDQVVIIDEATGRKMPDRRWGGGLHQAVEAKNSVTVRSENQTVATISYQNYFRMYHKLAGMTGTADTEAAEFAATYDLDVVVVPTNRPLVRSDAADRIYQTERAKFSAVMREIEEQHNKGRPILVGTTSVSKSEVLSAMLEEQGIKHHVLNAKNHAKEAEIVAQAGRLGAVTLSTNMAGRGTDILLGGNPEFLAKAEQLGDELRSPEGQARYAEVLARREKECAAEREQVLAVGGLHVLGTERHESRRIDNQLRGRAGRQGDSGSSRFYLSLQDEVLRRFGGERAADWLERLGVAEDEPIEDAWANKHVENAQKLIEGHNHDLRKSLLEYDDVMNQQRKAIYSLRRQIIEGRYQRELSDQDRKRGAAPPPALGASDHWTVESMAAGIRPYIAKAIESFYDQTPMIPPPGSTTSPPPSQEDAAKIRQHLGGLCQGLYQGYGVMVDLSVVLGDRAASVDAAAQQCAASLIQQRERIQDLAAEVLEALLHRCCAGASRESWDLTLLGAELLRLFNLELDLAHVPPDLETTTDQLWQKLAALIEQRKTDLMPLPFYRLARDFFVEEIDAQWIDHLTKMEHLREGIGLRGYGRKIPTLEYKKEGYDLFVALMLRIQENVAARLFHARPTPPASPQAAPPAAQPA